MKYKKIRKGLTITSNKPKKLAKEYLFTTYFAKMLQNKRIYISEFTFRSDKLMSLNLSLYFSEFAIIKIQNKMQSKEIIDSSWNDKISLISNQMGKLSTNINVFVNQTVFNIKILNAEFTKTNVNLEINEIQKYFLQYKKLLFSRQHYHFLDFSKTTFLFKNKKSHLYLYIRILGRIFKYLHKKNHSKYFKFIENLIHYLMKNNDCIKGIKFQIQGRLQAKDRATSKKLIAGKIPINSYNTNITYEKLSIQTPYGVYGVKMYVNYDKDFLIN